MTYFFSVLENQLMCCKLFCMSHYILEYDFIFKILGQTYFETLTRVVTAHINCCLYTISNTKCLFP
jgi:hypothetical protein